mgnify:CR=1 FL=1
MAFIIKLTVLFGIGAAVNIIRFIYIDCFLY